MMNPHSSEIIVKLSMVNFKYLPDQPNILSNCNLQLKKGERVGIIGDNGCGKSTIAKIILGILKPDSGAVSIFGRPGSWFNHFPEIAYVGDPGYNAEELGLPTGLTMKQAFDVVKKLHRYQAGFSSMADDIAKLLGLWDLLNRDLGALSTGQRKRFMAWMAFVKKPKLIILDEPFDGLDATVRDNIQDLMSQTLADPSVTLLLISHSIIDIDTYADQSYRLYEGGLSAIPARVFTLSKLKDGLVTQSAAFKTGQLLKYFNDLLDKEISASPVSVTIQKENNESIA